MFCLLRKHCMKRKIINTLSWSVWFNLNQTDSSVFVSAFPLQKVRIRVQELRRVLKLGATAPRHLYAAPHVRDMPSHDVQRTGKTS